MDERHTSQLIAAHWMGRVEGKLDILMARTEGLARKPSFWRELWVDIKERVTFLVTVYRVIRMIPWGALAGLGGLIWATARVLFGG